jgi:hypothetical protein
MRNPPYHHLKTAFSSSGGETDNPFATLTPDATTPSSMTTPYPLSTLSSPAPSRAAHALSNAQRFNLPPTTPFMPTTPPPFAPLLEIPPRVHIAALLGPCLTSYSTATSTGKHAASSWTPSITIPSTPFSRHEPEDAISSSSSTLLKPSSAPYPRAPLTLLGLKPGRSISCRICPACFSSLYSSFYGFFRGNWLPSDQGASHCLNTIIPFPILHLLVSPCITVLYSIT